MKISAERFAPLWKRITKNCARSGTAGREPCATTRTHRAASATQAFPQSYPQRSAPLLAQMNDDAKVFSRQKKPRTSLGEGKFEVQIRTARAGSRDLPTLNTTRSIEGLLHPSHALTIGFRNWFHGPRKKLNAPRPSWRRRPPRPAAARPDRRPRSSAGRCARATSRPDPRGPQVPVRREPAG